MPDDPQSRSKQCWVEAPGGIILAVKAQPAAKRSMIGAVIPAAGSPGWPPYRLKISVAARPEQGQANDAIRNMLAEYFRLSAGEVTLQTGASSRDKKFLLLGDRVKLAALINPP